MQLNLFRHALLQRLVASLLIFMFTLGALGTASAQQSTPGITYKVCKPPPNICLSKEAKEKWAKDNNCHFLEDVCKKTPPEQDNMGAKDEDKGFWGSMWDGVKGGLVYGYEFVKGLMIGLKDQVVDLWNLVTNIDDVVGGLIDLGKAFFQDPKGTLKQLATVLGQEAVDTITRATQCGAYDLGHVVGSYVSPAFALKLASKLKKFGKLEDATKAMKKHYGCASFVAGTMVSTPDGMVPIESIQIGGKVISRNEMSFADYPQVVTNTFGRIAPGYRLLQTETDTFKLTDEHPLWVQGKGWTDASNVVEDDVIAAQRGDMLVLSNRAVASPVRVYNFTVNATPDYFVGEGGMWAHNATCSIDVHTKPWKELTKGEKGFRGEYGIFDDLTEGGKFEPVGNSFDPRGKPPHVAYSEWAGQTGIDGMYKDAKGNYVIIESKATGGAKPIDPTCKEKLCTTVGKDRQMSEAWLDDGRLDKLFKTPAERAAYDAAKANGKVKKVYAVTDENGTKYFEIDDVVGNKKEVNVTNREWKP